MTEIEQPLRPLTTLQQAMIALAMVAMGAGMTINFVVVAPLARKAPAAIWQATVLLTAPWLSRSLGETPNRLVFAALA